MTWKAFKKQFTEDDYKRMAANNINNATARQRFYRHWKKVDIVNVPVNGKRQYELTQKFTKPKLTWRDFGYMRFTDSEINHMVNNGVTPTTVRNRINYKWTRKEIIEVPFKVNKRVFYKGQKKYDWNSIRFYNFSDEEIKKMILNDVTPELVRKRRNKGWTKEEIINTEKFEHRKQAI